MGIRPNAEALKGPDENDIATFMDIAQRLEKELCSIVVGQERVIRELLLALFAGGHVLLEGVPGLGKTLLIRTLSDALALKFARIQFTPDLMPADIVGTTIVTDQPDAGSGEASVSLASSLARSSPISSWPTRLTAPPPKHNQPCLRVCRNARSV